MRRYFRVRALMMVPSGSIVVMLFVLPVVYFFAMSFWQVRSYRIRSDATVEQYVAVFTEYQFALGYTLLVAVCISLITSTIAFAFAYFCRFKAGRFALIFLIIALVTLFGGYLTKIYMWKTILGSKGILNSALIYLGIIETPIEAFLFSPIAVVITLTHYTLPLALLPIYGSLHGMSDVPMQAARDLGAKPLRVFYDIVLPQTRVGLLTAVSLTFIFAAGDYVTPLLVGGPNTSMIGLFIQSQFGVRYNPPLGSAMSFSIMFCGAIIIGLFWLVIFGITRRR